jgi:hypothetical protein
VERLLAATTPGSPDEHRRARALVLAEELGLAVPAGLALTPTTSHHTRGESVA